LFQSGTSGKVPRNDRVRCAKRTLPWASAGGELARYGGRAVSEALPPARICDKATARRVVAHL
jgi:hypothetical protein